MLLRRRKIALITTKLTSELVASNLLLKKLEVSLFEQKHLFAVTNIALWTARFSKVEKCARPACSSVTTLVEYCSAQCDAMEKTPYRD